MEAIVSVLRPYAHATVLLSVDNNPLLSIVEPNLCVLKHHTVVKVDYREVFKSLK